MKVIGDWRLGSLIRVKSEECSSKRDVQREACYYALFDCMYYSICILPT